MDSQASDLIRTLGLAPHPEGGYYRELYRSASRVQPLDSRPERPALTTIYFLLPAGEVSRWHRVASDEVWHFLDGAPLEILMADGAFASVTRQLIGAVRDGGVPEAVVPAHAWQTARSTGAWTLVNCIVGPGFDFADFVLLRDVPDEAAALGRQRPDLTAFI